LGIRLLLTFKKSFLVVWNNDIQFQPLLSFGFSYCLPACANNGTVIFLQSLTLLLEIIQSLFPPEFQEEFPAEPGCSSAPLT